METMEFGGPHLYNPDAAAKTLSISRSTLYDLLAKGAISSVKVGRSRRIPRAEIERYVASLSESQALDEDPS